MSFVNILLYISLPLALLVYLYLKKKYSYFEEQGILYNTPSWIMGNMSGIGSKIHILDFIRQHYKEFKGKDVISGVYMMIAPALVAIDLELVKHIFIKDFNKFHDRGVFVNEEDEPLTGHLFALKGEKWRFLRNKLSPVFSSGKIKMMYETISGKGHPLVEAITASSRSGTVDVKNITNSFSIDVIASCAFGIESNTLQGQNDEIVKIFKMVFGEEGMTVLRNIFVTVFPNFAKLFHVKVFNKIITNFFTDIITESITQREDSKSSRNDFLDMLIQLKNKGSIDGEFSTESRKLTLNECIAQAFLFFLGGAETSSTTISFAICELGKNSLIQEKLRNEIIEKTRETNGEITYENLQDMTYLTQVVNETLRLYPGNPVTIREANIDYKVPNSNHVIKKGTPIMIPIVGFHYDEEFWKNPNEFDPDRFSAEESANRPNLAFMPFGEGPRNCIGMRFAQVSVKFAVATVVKNFKFALDMTKTEYPFKFDPKSSSVSAAGGFWVTFENIGS